MFNGDSEEESDETSSIDDNAEIEDISLWEDLHEEDSDSVQAVLITNSKQRLSCFAHSLQLVVGDGLKKLQGVGRAITKVGKISKLLHKSTVFKER